MGQWSCSGIAWHNPVGHRVLEQVSTRRRKTHAPSRGNSPSLGRSSSGAGGGGLGRGEALGHALFRAVVPVIGILAFGLDARQVLLLYAIDTLLALATAFGLLAWQFLPVHAEDRPTLSEKINGVGGALAIGLFVGSVTMVAASVPLWFGFQFSLDALRDVAAVPGFQQAALAQLATSGLSFILQALRESPGEAARRRHRARFAFALGRWLVLYFVAAALFGQSSPWAPFVLVVLYGAITVVAEAMPENRRAKLAANWERMNDERP